MKTGYVYILTNQKNGTLYIGVTSDLAKRIWEHKNNVMSGFSKKYNLHHLVYYEIFDTIESAIEREKQLKKKKRIHKLEMINAFNPNWLDLYDNLF